MFWRVAGYSQPSPIEAILDKEQYTLEELLDEDDLIQEVKSLNNRLLEFLKERTTVQQLLKYLIESPGDSDDPKRQYKYPYAACEIFACEVEGVFATLMEDEELMGMLFGFLETDQTLNSSLAGYFGRVVGSLLMRRTSDLMSYLKQHQEVLELLVKHLRTTSIAEVIVQLVGSDEQSYMYYGSHHMYWLAETPLMQLLISRLSPEYSADTQANAAEILGAIAHTQPSPLASQLGSSEYMEMLFQRALAPEARSVLVSTLNVCIALLEPKRVSTDSNYATADPSSSGTQRGDTALKAAATKSILAELPRLVELLRHPHFEGETSPAVLATTFGKLDPPLGSRRWKVVELLSVLAATKGQGVEEQLIATGAIQMCMDLFIMYPFNNLLHHAVSALLSSCLEGSSTMLQYLIQQSKLATWLASAPPAIASSNGGPLLRSGYMGHVISLGNRLVTLARQNTEVKGMLSKNEKWELFVSTTLQERNELENVAKWACGRPSAMGSASIDSEPDENIMESDDHKTSQTNAKRDPFERYPPNEDDDDDDDDDDQDDDGSPSHQDIGDMTNRVDGLKISEEAPDSWESLADGNSSEEESDEAIIMPAPSPSTLNDECIADDDSVLLLTSEEEAKLSEDITIGGDSPCRHGSPISSPRDLSSPKGQATLVIEETEPQFNAFQYWRTEMAVDIPEDI